MKKRVNITLSNADLAMAEIICNLTGESRSELVSNLIMYKIYDLLEDDRISWEEVKNLIKEKEKNDLFV